MPDKYQMILDTHEITPAADANEYILPKHVDLGNQRRASMGLPPNVGRVAYRWTARDVLPLYGADGELDPMNDSPLMRAARSPGVPVPSEDWPEVIVATGYTPPDGWRLYVTVPIY